MKKLYDSKSTRLYGKLRAMVKNSDRTNMSLQRMFATADDLINAIHVDCHIRDMYCVQKGNELLYYAYYIKMCVCNELGLKELYEYYSEKEMHHYDKLEVIITMPMDI